MGYGTLREAGLFFLMISKIGDAFRSMLLMRSMFRTSRRRMDGQGRIQNGTLGPIRKAVRAGSCRSVSIRRTVILGREDLSVYLTLRPPVFPGSRGAYAFWWGSASTKRNFSGWSSFSWRDRHGRNWLKALGSELRDYGLVIFNGRSWTSHSQDQTQDRKSAAMGRQAPHGPLMLQTLLRGRLPSCSLSTVERMVLGVHRSGEDVPGREIPRIYTNFLASLDASPLRGVFYHNVLDVISMAALQVHIGSLAEMDEGNERDRYDKVRRPLGRGGDARDLKESVDEGPCFQRL